MEDILNEILECKKCDLHKSCFKKVPGEGRMSPDICFVGEAPGQAENLCGKPFVGRAGKLLTNMINAIKYCRDDVYIINICKCRPPNNRKPTRKEIETCKPYLVRQLDIIKPKIIIALGASAAEGILGPGEGVTKRREGWHEYNNIPVKVIYHPAACLYNPNLKKEVQKDLKEVLEVLMILGSYH